MEWYKKLSKYFPIEEMKSQQHMELLLKEQGDVYRKDESENHVLMYAEFEEFIFVDYLWVSSESRGQGIGNKLIDKLKEKNKSIILEVEPIDYENTDSEKRLRFYAKNNFQHAGSIIFHNKSFRTDEEAPLEILFWAPNNEPEKTIYYQMKQVYERIHAYKSEELYGKKVDEVDQVLSHEENKKGNDLLKDL